MLKKIVGDFFTDRGRF